MGDAKAYPRGLLGFRWLPSLALQWQGFQPPRFQLGFAVARLSASKLQAWLRSDKVVSLKLGRLLAS